ncbi:ABC transporter permease [Patescibacteria group bacterium]|nr:ABC transporter permease [Patescibacteria group bacterium]
MFVLIKRIFKSGWLNFKRNSGLSLATIFIMLIVISLATSLFISQKATRFLILSLQEKVDISVYFKEDSPEEDILELKDEISKIPEVKNIEYVSRTEALERFTQRHKDNPLLMASLVEVENPFLAALNIKAWEATQYGIVANFLEDNSSENLIEKVDYYQRKPVIERIFSITSGINKAGIGASLIFGILAILIAFNTIKLAIYNSREEIEIQRLVGASNRFIRGPFLIQGVISGFLATLICLLIFLPLCYFLSPKLEILIPGLNIYSFFVSNFWTLLLIQILTGIGLGVISSIIAIRRYLEV